MVKHRDDGSFVRNWCSRIGGIGPGDHLARLSALLVTCGISTGCEKLTHPAPLQEKVFFVRAESPQTEELRV